MIPAKMGYSNWNPYIPCEDSGEVYHKSVNFHMHTPSVWFFRQIYHRGDDILFRSAKWAYLLGIHTPPMFRCFLNLPQGVCVIRMELPNRRQRIIRIFILTSPGGEWYPRQGALNFCRVGSLAQSAEMGVWRTDFFFFFLQKAGQWN